MKIFELTQKRKENVSKLLTNAATVIFAGLIIGAFISQPFRPKVLVVGLALYFVTAILVWFLEP